MDRLFFSVLQPDFVQRHANQFQQSTWFCYKSGVPIERARCMDNSKHWVLGDDSQQLNKCSVMFAEIHTNLVSCKSRLGPMWQLVVLTASQLCRCIHVSVCLSVCLSQCTSLNASESCLPSFCRTVSAMCLWISCVWTAVSKLSTPPLLTSMSVV